MKKYRVLIIVILSVIAFLVSLCFIPINATKLIPLIEKQAENDLGVKVHIDKLVLRVGPYIKVKSPVMHMMYKDGQKFAQLDNVKFYISWGALFQDDMSIKKMFANKFILKLNSDDKNLASLLEKLSQKEFNDTPNIFFKKYSITYFDKLNDNKINLSGTDLELSKLLNHKNYKLKTIGKLSIDDKQYISYDLAFVPNMDMEKYSLDFDILNLAEQIENFDFHSDIIGDLKLYKNPDSSTYISGFVNFDNISVLDIAKAGQESFIYLTFLGDKMGIQSRIQASADKKVYIEGAVNNSKKPKIDLKVKTDEIKLADLYKKLKLFADCTRFKGIDKLSGILTADFSLKGDLNKIKSNGYLKVKDASIEASGIDIKSINSDIDFSNNVINIVNAVGYVNDSPIIAKGKIDKNINIELLMNKVELKHLCPSSYGVSKGVASIVANVSGTLDNLVHKENILIENFESKQNGSNIEFATLKIDTNKNNTAYINNILIKTPYTEVIKIPAVNLNIDKDTIKIPNTNIFMPNSKVVAKADVTNYNTKDLSFNVNMDGTVYSRDIKAFNSHTGYYPLKTVLFGNKLQQTFNSQVLIENTLFFDEPVVVNVNSKINDNSLKIDDLSISPYHGNFKKDSKLNLKGAKKVIVTGQIENLSNPVFKNIRLFIPQQLNINLFDTVAQVKGDLFINGKVNQPEIVGQLSVINAINQYLQASVSNASIDFNKTLALINAPQVKVNDSAMSVNATVSTDFSKELFVKNANIKSKYLNIDTILMYKDSPIMKMLPIALNDCKLYSERALMSLYGTPVHFSSLSADFKLVNNLLKAKNISAEMYNGKLAGSLDFDLKQEHYDTKLQARGVSAAPIFDIISTRKETISGVMDFDAGICGELATKQTLNGNIKFVVHNGRMNTLGKLEHLLYAQNIVADNMLRTSLSVVTKAITLKDTGLFKYLRGDIDLQSGIANIKMLQSQGPLMALFIKGQYNPSNDYAKLIVLGRLSDEVVAGLGAFGEFSFKKLMIMLSGEEERFNMLPEDFEKIPALPAKNTKEFRSIINGIIDKPSSVLQFNWVSYSQKSLRQKEVPMGEGKVPDFIEALPY